MYSRPSVFVAVLVDVTEYLLSVYKSVGVFVGPVSRDGVVASIGVLWRCTVNC